MSDIRFKIQITSTTLLNFQMFTALKVIFWALLSMATLNILPGTDIEMFILGHLSYSVPSPTMDKKNYVPFQERQWHKLRTATWNELMVDCYC